MISILARTESALWGHTALQQGAGTGSGGNQIPPFELDIHLVENHMDKIDEAYLQKFFKAYIDSLKATGEGSEESKKALEELYSEFAKLSAEHQRIATNIISDIQTGKLNVDDDFSLVDLITKYARDEQDNKFFSDKSVDNLPGVQDFPVQYLHLVLPNGGFQQNQ